MKTNLTLILAVALCAALSCSRPTSVGKFSQRERDIIEKSDSVMYVYTLHEPLDTAVLRTKCVPLDPEEISSPLFKTLTAKMMATVQSPQQDGVGLAATQVGLTHRVIVVLRYDKPGEPFGIYPNARLLSHSDSTVVGPEGCLSFPPYRGDVTRYTSVVVGYTDPVTLQSVCDTVYGYSAIIFQHELDHLDGTIYKDKAPSTWEDGAWKAERDSLGKVGLYLRPSWMK